MRAPALSGTTSSLLLAGLALLALLPGCSRRQPAAERGPGRDRGTPAPVPLRYEPCARAGAGQPPRPARWGNLELLPAGELLKASDQATPPARLLLGAIADTKEALPATLRQLERLATQLRALGATAIVVLGGVDSSFEGTRAVLQALRGLFVIGLPGDRESRSGWQAAMESLEARGADLSRARGLRIPGLSMIGVPGYHLPHHLLAREQGCSYGPADLRALAQVARGLPQPRLLLAHGPPRGAGAEAIDRGFGEVNIGDPLLLQLIGEADIRFGLFGHVHESAGRATTREGRPVAEGEWSQELLLNVGSADSVPHEDLRGRWSRGSAALLELSRQRGPCPTVHGKGGSAEKSCLRARFRMLSLDDERPAGPAPGPRPARQDAAPSAREPQPPPGPP